MLAAALLSGVTKRTDVRVLRFRDAESGAFETPGGRDAGAFRTGFLVGEERGVSYGAPVFCRQIPLVRIAAEIRRGVAGEVWSVFGGVAAAVMGRVAASELLPDPERRRHLGRSSGTASELGFREAVSRLKGGRGLVKGGGRGRRSEKRRHADTANRLAGLQGRRHRDPGGMGDVAASGRSPGGRNAE